MTPINQFKDIISLWPTSADFGRDLGIGEISARAMKRRNKIPSKYWDAVVNAAKAKGIMFITHEMLAKLYSPKPKKTRSN